MGGNEADFKFRDDLLKDALNDEQLSAIDPFDKIQLEYVLRTCRRVARCPKQDVRSLRCHAKSEVSQANDADRLRKYLQRFDLDWDRITKTKGLA